MIIRSLCNSCFQPYELLIEPSDIAIIKEVADADGFTCPCPRNCGGRINLVGEPTIESMAKDRRMKEPLKITGKELFKAIHGNGLPDEIPSSPELVDSLFQSHKVLDVEVEVIENDIYLHSLKLSDGLKIHLSSGRRGAKVLKITRENNGTVNPG